MCIGDKRPMFKGWHEPTSEHYDGWLGLKITDESRCAPYNRDDYSYPQDIEQRITLRQGIVSYYTGRTFESLEESDVEHVVALSEAHDSGMCEHNRRARRQFARDMLNLTLASPQLNRYEKGAKDAGEWLPELNQCWFVRTVIQVKRKYGLTADWREYDVLKNVLTRCEVSP